MKLPISILHDVRRLPLYYSVGIAILLVIIAGQILALRQLHRTATTPAKSQARSIEPITDINLGSAVWSKQIDLLGGQQAYVLFKQTYQVVSEPNQHQMAHLFGQLLYDKLGINAIGVCDDSFAFGCYHGYYGEAITKAGTSILSDLDKACIKQYGEKGLGCQHGIGHGVLGYLGDDKLKEALADCAQLTWKGPIGGCTSGVFMEYNFHTINHVTRLEIRPLDALGPNYPCTTVDPKFLQACYFEQPQWWGVVYDHDFHKLGQLCHSVSDPTVREACFRGLGNSVGPYTSFDVQQTIDDCQQSPNAREAALCQAGASWSFFADPRHKQDALQVCHSVDTSMQNYCVTNSDLYNDRSNQAS